MKISGKDVYIGNILVCTEYTSKVIGKWPDSQIGEKSHEGDIIEQNILFIKDKNNFFVKVTDTQGFGSIALKIYGAAQRYTTTPHNAGHLYVEVKPYFHKNDNQKYYLKDLVEIAKNINKDQEYEKNNFTI